MAVIDPRPLPDRIWENVHRCALACPDGARISYLGVMLSRPSAGLRLNVAGVPADQMMSYLEAIGWPAPGGRVEALLDRVFPLVDGITLALDVGESVGPRLGLECVISQGRGLKPRQTALLELLVELGCCSSSERDALAALPRVIGPLQSHAPWPASLIAKDIARPAGSSSAITLGLNHVKLDVEEGEPLRAKAYPYFRTSSVDRIDTSRSRPGKVGGGAEVESCGADALEVAIERALGFLSSRRGQSGLWRDLHAIEGGADHFVSAVVGAILAETRRPRARAEAEATWRALLRRQDPLGGWGWSVLVTPDSDTTCWALRLAEAIGEGESEPAHRARRFLQERQSASGGLAPYLQSDFPAAQALDGIRGWTSAHDCMTGAAGSLPGAVGANARRHLRASQRADGSWRPYWWSDPAYATALAAEALTGGEDPADAARVAAAVDWGLQRVELDGGVRSEAVGGASTFVTAWLVRMLACGSSDESRDALQRTSRWLSAHQRTDGSWASSADMWVPPRDLDPSVLAGNDGLPTWAIICWDERRIFTTAVALGALERAKQTLETSASAVQSS